jgi:TIR domain
MPHLIFVSYSRINVKYQKDAELIQKLVNDLKNDLEVQAPMGGVNEVCFFDTTNIETGSDWNEDLSEAAARSRVALALFSPSYFSSVWCGREFQVFLDRQKQAAPAIPGERASVAILPVIWIRPTALPEPASAIQNTDASLPYAPFPAEYTQIGLRQIMLLNAEPQYTQVRIALGERILKAVTAARLPEVSNVDLRNYRSAWEAQPSADQKQDGSDSVTKTCFVYLANDGWHWRPYAEPEPKVGAMAQQITGEIGLQYEEIPCNAELPARLKDTNKKHVPTVLISDPSSWTNPTITKALADYDDRYFLNCGFIVPWDVPSPATDARWRRLSQEVCPQKTRVPPLNHEWVSVLSPGVLKSRTLATVEEIRMRMLNHRAASGADIARAENDAVAEAAQADGISVRSAPVVSNASNTEVR